MPTLPSSVTTNNNGEAVVTFTSGTLLASQLNDFWAEVTYDGKTEYWDLDPAMLSSDGKSFTIKFDETFDNKTVSLKIYGFDTAGVQTGFSNAVNITVEVAQASVSMPVLPSSVTTNSSHTAVITFTSGTLLASQLNDLWAEVTYDGKAEYWDLHPAMLSSDGKSFTITFDSSFVGKTVIMRLYGFDTSGTQVPFSNSISIYVQ